MFGFSGCRRNIGYKINEGETDVVLVDYYTCVAGTVGGNHSENYTLYYYSEDEAKLVVRKTADGKDETYAEYIVPYEAVDATYKAIAENKLDMWKYMRKQGGIAGGVSNCKFRKGTDYITVSTANMPKNGIAMVGGVGAVIMSYERDEYLVKDGE